MAFVLAPLGFAAAGGLLGGTWGAAVGWLVGSWLFGPKADRDNQIFDPGAQEMPRVNQALRGVTIPVMFGTNRVPSNIVWQKNFTTIRNETENSGGGGKGGGSGLGKGGASGGTTVTYEYKWDLLYHLGMSHEDMNLFGGWLGSERMNDSTLLGIINNSNSGFTSFFRSDVDRPQDAELIFDEGFFHGAQATGDANATNWSHFETEEGGAYRWPYSVYIGFKQLNLGDSAVVPQVTWEIGPGDADFEFDSGHEAFWTSITTTDGTDVGVIKGDTGSLYQVDGAFGGGNTFRVYNATTDAVHSTRTDAQFDADATAAGLDPGSAYTFTSDNFAVVLPEKNRIIAFGRDIGVGTRSNWAVLVYKINASNSLEVVGGYAARSNDLEAPNKENILAYVHGSGSDDSNILLTGTSEVGASFDLHLWCLPSLTAMESYPVADDANNTWDARSINLRTAVTEITDRFGFHSSYRNYNKWGFFVPTVDVGLLGFTWKSRLYWYISKADIEWHIDNPADPNGTNTIYNRTGTYPNGFLAYVTVTVTSNVPAVNASWTVDETWIDRSDETQVIPFSDGQQDEDGNATDGYDYSPSATSHRITTGIAAGASAVIFFKDTPTGEADRGTTGTFTRAQMFLWNPLSRQAKRYANYGGSFADSETDWGFPGASKKSYTIQGTSGYYDEETTRFYITGYLDGGNATDNIFLARFGTFDIGGAEDVYPPYIIYELLTNPLYEYGLSASDINITSYQAALLYCENEGIKVSTVYYREGNTLQLIDQLLALYGGYLIDSGGQITFGLQEFTTTPIRTIDNSRLVAQDDGSAPVTVIHGAVQDTFNKIKVNYIDRNLEYRQNFVEVADEVDIDLNGVRPREFPPQFVMTEALANKIAVRALWSNLYSRKQFNFKLGPKDADLEPGDVITLVDSYHPYLSSGAQVRIVRQEEKDNMIFDIQAVEELQYINASTLSPSSQTAVTTPNGLFGPVAPAANFTMYELPKEFQGANANLFIGYRQQSITMGAYLYLSADGVSFAKVDNVQPFIISGIVKEGLPLRSPGHVEENVEVYLMPDTRSVAFNAASPTYCQTFTLDDVGPAGRALGTGLMFINSEMMAYEGVNLVAQNHYKFDKVFRGWGGTHIQAHNSGDTWHKHGGGIFQQAINEDKIGTIVHYKVAPYNFNGLEYNIASVDARTYQIQGTYWRPQAQAPLRTFVQSPQIVTVQSENLVDLSKKRVITNGSPVQIEWPDSSRDRGYGTRGYGDGGYGRFQTDTTSHNWRIEVLSGDLATVVRCTTVATTAFLYTTAANSEDFNGWNGNFAVRVTPYNDFGDALRSRTKILELFE